MGRTTRLGIRSGERKREVLKYGIKTWEGCLAIITTVLFIYLMIVASTFSAGFGPLLSPISEKDTIKYDLKQELGGNVMSYIECRQENTVLQTDQQAYSCRVIVHSVSNPLSLRNSTDNVSSDFVVTRWERNEGVVVIRPALKPTVYRYSNITRLEGTFTVSSPSEPGVYDLKIFVNLGFVTETQETELTAPNLNLTEPQIIDLTDPNLTFSGVRVFLNPIERLLQVIALFLGVITWLGGEIQLIGRIEKKRNDSG